MNAKTAREQRRETKRTLGAKLEEFRDEERRRLVDLERRLESVDEILQVGAALGHTAPPRFLARVRDRASHADDVICRGFFGRLKWLLVGA